MSHNDDLQTFWQATSLYLPTWCSWEACKQTEWSQDPDTHGRGD